MLAAARWVRHDRKRPVTPSGRSASSTNTATWAPYMVAKSSVVGDGLGFVLGDGFACLDLDHCLVDGKPLPWAQVILDRVPGAYVEVSPSGSGLHVWGRAPELPGSRRDNVECYSVGRYITVTGNVFRVGGLADLSKFF